MKLMAMYEAMKRHLGRRGWWPVLRTGSRPDERPVYDPSRRSLTEVQRFEIAVGAILTQNTSWTNVEKAMVELHRSKNLSPARLRRLPVGRLARLIRSSGYFNQKAKKLKSLIRFLDEGSGGRSTMERLRRRPVPSLRADLLGVNGIGPETADSILLYALDRPVFVIDAYTRRIFSRHGWIRGGEPYDEIREWFEGNLPKSVKLWNDYHAQLVEIGKRYCHRRRPECRSCPLYRRELFCSPEVFKRAMS